ANDQMQRVYGVSFPDKKQLGAHKKRLEEAAKRDHRRIGDQQNLFMFHQLAPGCPFFLPDGCHIYTTLVNYLRSLYKKYGYDEVITPNFYNVDLWRTSGHWDYYKDNMFSFEHGEGTTFALKPMNCPGHCLMFKHQRHHANELPMRVCDFGVIHRNEASGALTGLTRVRRFQQDDGHIFCRPDQVMEEVKGVLAFVEEVYGIFGFEFNLALSTRPEKKFIGSLETWTNAEKQ
ncbi:threonine-tRNA ligase, class IIa, partial [Kipferlia bialata]